MHKDDRSYSFLLTHKTKTNIYIRRIEISKKLIHSGVASLILTFGIISLGITGFIKNTTIIKSETNVSVDATLAGQTTKLTQNNLTAENKSINYDRPASFEGIASTGGPAVPFQLTLVESDEEEKALESQIRLIETTSNPAFLPTMWAHLGKINNEFGFRRNPFGGRSYEFHAGMDIGGDRGDLIVAPANGVVINADWQGGYGNMIEIDHGSGLTTRYGHLSRIGVQVGETIQRGQAIGLIGSTGRSTGPHLHYELRLNDKPINPRRFLPPEPPEIRALNAE
ncbi:MAG: M23 family metallopeptidase [Acidobacteriota bacterium]|nr:M23 family metallopeptidase [Acidobacteriota bacterium]